LNQNGWSQTERLRHGNSVANTTIQSKNI